MWPVLQFLGGNLHITLAQLGLRVEIQESNLSCDIGTGILMNSRWFSAGLPYKTNQSTWVFDNVKRSWPHGVRCPLEPSVRIPGGWWHLQRNWSNGPAIPWNSGKLSYCASMSHTKYIIPAWSVWRCANWSYHQAKKEKGPQSTYIVTACQEVFQQWTGSLAMLAVNIMDFQLGGGPPAE